MPQKPKKRPPPPSNTYETVTVQNAETHLSQFIKYYKGIGLVPEDEWKHFLEALFRVLPMSFRIAERSRRCNNVYEGRPGTLTESEVLREFLKTEVMPKLSGAEVDGDIFQMATVPWYPKQMAWKTNIDTKMLADSTEMKPLRDFIAAEERVLNVFKQELTSMIPPLLVDIHPNHKVLELRSGPGYHSAQIMEMLYANPKKMPDGFLVANEKDHNKVQYRWNQGTNILYTHHPTDKFPDLYLTAEHDPDSKVLYDRVFLDATTSNDGTMRTNHKLRTGWTITNAQKNHSDLKKQLKRGLELLELNGQLVYFTRSMNPLENEAVVAAMLDEAPGSLQLVNVRNRLPDFHVRAGMTSWKVMSQGLVFYENFESAPAWFQKENEQSLFTPDNASMYNLERCVRVMPHDNDTGALFVAVFSKFGPLPWEKQDEEEEDDKQAMETDAAGDAAKNGEKDEKKSPYMSPIRCDVNVCVSEIEWTTDITDENLTTKTDSSSSTYQLAPMSISKSCIPIWLQKKIREENSGYKDVSDANPDWAILKQQFDIRRFDPMPNCVQFDEEGKNTVYYYCSSNVKKLILYNKEAIKTSRKSAGGMTFMKGSTQGKPDLYTGGVIPLMPFVNKRLVSVPKVDLVLLLQNKEVVFSKFTDRTKQLLTAMGDTQGYIYFYYEPKGKNPDPKCTIVLKRERFTSFVKQSYSYRDNEENHQLRLCGISPDEEVEELHIDTT